MTHLSYPNGIMESYEYGESGYVEKVVFSRNDEVISTRSYKYASSGAIERVQTLEGTEIDITDFEYNANGQLAREKYSLNGIVEDSIEYAYDRDGNRIQKTDGSERTTYRYDSKGSLAESITDGVRTLYQYDASGRLISEDTEGSLTKKFTWNSRNRLNAIDLDDDGQADIEYRYDDFGDLVERKVNGVSTVYTVDRIGALSQVLLEKNVSSEVFSVFGVDLVAKQSQSGINYHHLDHLGSTVVTSSETGEIGVRSRFDAFGNPIISGSIGRFHEMQQDTLSGLYFARARHYSPMLGRFISRDQLSGSVTSSQSQNRYAYAHNNPVNSSDPSGYSPYMEAVVVNALKNILLKGLNIYKTYHAAKTRGQVLQQLGWFVGAGVAYYMFEFLSNYRDGEAFPGGTLDIDIFEYKWDKDIWVKSFKITASASGKEKYEVEIGKLGGSNTSAVLFLANCGGKFCGGGAGLEYPIREIPEATGDKVKDKDKGAFLSVKAAVNITTGLATQDLPVDLSFVLKFKALSTFKYEVTILSGSGLQRATQT